MLLKNRVYLQQDGFTLVEVLVAIVILMVGLLGMFQSINLALNQNLQNQLRHKAVSIAEEQLNEIKGRSFENISGNTKKSVPVPMGATFSNFSVERKVADLAATDSKTKQISVRVWWRYRGKGYEHQTSTGIGVQ